MFQLFSCCITQLCFSFSLWTFSWMVLWYRAEFIVPLIMAKCWAKHPQIITLLLWGSFYEMQCLVSWNTTVSAIKNYSFNSSVHKTLLWNSWRSSKCFANVRQAFVQWFLLFHESHFVPNVFLRARDTQRYFHVALSFFNFWIISGLALGKGSWPLLGRSTISNFLHLNNTWRVKVLVMAS